MSDEWKTMNEERGMGKGCRLKAQGEKKKPLLELRSAEE